VEEKLYFYHSDAIGSTGFVTDVTGTAYEHLEYFPSGEVWVDERTETQRVPYLFSGKELDEETSLSYFGARYYDARQGQWISPDPILDEMLEIERLAEPDLSTSPFRLQGLTYTYAANDPVNQIDPTGLGKAPAGKGRAGKAKGGKVPVAKANKKIVKAKPAKTKFTRNKVGKVVPLKRDGRIQTFFKTVKKMKRLERVDAQLAKVYLDTGTGTTPTTRKYVHDAGYLKDDAGHVIGRRLGGPGGDIDIIFPQTPNINRGAFRMFEGEIYDAVTKHGAADVTLKFHYKGFSRRPYRVDYAVTVKSSAGKTVSQWKTKSFDN
jgi:RHS repeat-associated protein